MTTKTTTMMLSLAFLATLLLAAEAGCPYSALWLPNSPVKLPDEEIQAYVTRSLQQAGAPPTPTKTVDDFKGKGAGTCSYVNPFTQSPTCVQMVGSKYEGDEAAAREFCDNPGLPGAVGTFEAGASCAAFEDENFGGVCVTGEGTPEETASSFVEEPGNALGGCSMTIMGCENFGGGTWYAVGGKCVKDENDEQMQSIVDVPEGSTATLEEGECKLQPGIAGGGHMDMNAFWTSACANSNSSYSTPRRWTAATKTITTQKDKTVTTGRVWYDLENNRRREDSFLEEGEPNIFQTEKNNTFIHMGPTFYMIAWKDDGTYDCRISRSPVGILRPNWIIDSEGYDAVSQYLGTEYMMYEGAYRRVKKFRKTEPLEDAYMIQSFDDQEVWETPEGKKRRPLNRQTPGAPFQGDAVNMYFNHQTDFSDDVFEIYKSLDCKERDFNRTRFREEAERLANETGIEFDASAPGLNFNSSFHVDSSVLDKQCDECDITYAVRSVDTEKETSADAEKNVTEAEEAAPAPPVTESAGESPAEAVAEFSGSEQVNDLILVEWTYSNNVLSMMASLDKDAWFAIAFPEIPCLMEPAVSVIALPEGEEVSGNRYSITSHAMPGIQVSNDLSEIPSFSTSKEGGKVVIKLDKAVAGEDFPLSVTWAHGFEPTLGYHGGSGRGCFSVKPKQ